MRVRVGYERLLKVSPVAGIGEIFNEFRRGCEQSVEAVLDGAIPDGHRQMGLTAAGLTVKDQRPPLGNEVQPEVRTDQGLPKSGLQGEVELIDGLEEGEVCASGATLQSRLLPSRYFLGK